MLKAILFDLDGTLIDSLADLATAVNRMLVENGHPPRDLALFPEFIGDGMRQLVTRALPESARDEASIDRCLRDYQKHYESCWHDQTRVYDGMLEVLLELKARGFRLGCISNKPHHFTQLCCAHFIPEGILEIVFGQRDQVPRKPAPTGALEAATLLGLSPTELAYVGDSGIDMQFARNADMTGIGVTWGFRSVEELQAHGAHYLAQTPADLLKISDTLR